MTNEKLTPRVDEGTEKETAGAIRALIEEDLEVKHDGFRFATERQEQAL